MVAAWIDGCAAPAVADEIERHLDTCDSCRSALAGAVHASRRPARLGRFVLEHQLGAGAMGEVYAALDPELGRRVALKLPRVDGDGGDRVARLLHEARMMAQLSHPNVIAVHEVGAVGDVPYIVMEQVDGTDLVAWRRTEPRAPAAIVAVVADAARGLAAVHRVGLVHRDVKPSNILIDRDGRARIGDFGLAGGDATSAAAASLTLDITQAGAVLGTPAYMAPEQLRGERATPASDQFALCVVLYELLCGERPFAGDDLPELTRHVLAGDIRAPAARIPAHVLRVIRRGLAVDPAARFASVGALADALEPRPRRVGPLFAATAAAAVLSAGALALALWPRPVPDPCGGGAAELAPVWNPYRRAAVNRGLTAASALYGTNSAALVGDALDRYAASWSAGYSAACVANRVRGIESDALFDRRSACLTERLRRLDALVDRLAAPTAAEVERATSAALALPDIAACSDTRALGEAIADRVPPAALAGVDERIAALETQLELGNYKAVVAAAAPLLVWIGQLDAPHRMARVLGDQAVATHHVGDVAGAEASFRAALDQAARAHDDALAARLWGALINIVGVLEGHRAQALAMVDVARLALVRAGGSPELEAALESNIGAVKRTAGDFAGARASLERALALTEQVHGKDAPASLSVMTNYANLLDSEGRYADAVAMQQRMYTASVRAHGAAHPDTAQIRGNLAAGLQSMGDYAHAETELRGALSVLDSAWGSDNKRLLMFHDNLGVVLGHLGKTAEATAEFERVIALAQRAPIVEADALDSLARLSLTSDPPRAVALLRRVVALRESTVGPDHPDTAIALNNLGDALRSAHDCRAAMPDYLRAESQFARLGKRHPYLASPLTGRGLCLLALGRRAEAVPLLIAARELAAATQQSDLVEEIDRAHALR